MNTVEQNHHLQTGESMGNAPVAADRRALLAGISGLAAGALLAGAKTAHAGPLTPPPGPVASTPGPEPRIAINAANTPGNASATFRIIQPGSYYLEGNVQGEPGKHGIEIFASGVTVDLRGFSILNSGLEGISSAGARGSIRIHDGHIRSARTGINLAGSVGIIVQNITVTACAGSGIIVGRGAIVDSCVVENCGTTLGGSGVGVAAESIVSNCSISEFGGSMVNVLCTGITLGILSRVRDCTVCSVSSQLRAVGLAASSDSIVEHCSIIGITGGADSAGVSMSAGSSVMRCNFYNTPLAILATSQQLSIVGNTINGLGNSVGVRLGPTSSCHIEGNRFESHLTGVDGGGSTCVVVRNVFQDVAVLTAAMGATAVVGPVITAGNAATATSPIANIAY